MDRQISKKLIVAAAVIGLLVLFRALGFDRYFTLSYIKSSQAEFAALYARHALAATAAYVAIYILVTTLSLPGAAVMTLAGGALFGLWKGTLIVSFASTAGATLACLVSRYLLRDWVQSRFGDRLSAIDKGMEKEGAFYLFTLRLIPIFPFFVINLVMGLTRIPLTTFCWVSQLGMLPATIVYVNAGRELARIESLSGILSLRLLFSFSLLGLFPLAAKRALRSYENRNR